jgi:hypothetical protein
MNIKKILGIFLIALTCIFCIVIADVALMLISSPDTLGVLVGIILLFIILFITLVIINYLIKNFINKNKTKG